MDAHQGRRRRLWTAALLSAFLSASAVVGYVGFFLEDATGAVMATAELEDLRNTKAARRRGPGSTGRTAAPPVPPREPARVAEEARVRFAGAYPPREEYLTADALMAESMYAASSVYTDGIFESPLLVTAPIVSHGAGGQGFTGGGGGGGPAYGTSGGYASGYPIYRNRNDDNNDTQVVYVLVQAPEDPPGGGPAPGAPVPTPEPSAPLLFAASSLVVARALRGRGPRGGPRGDRGSREVRIDRPANT